jgi:hypothetical protein
MNQDQIMAIVNYVEAIAERERRYRKGLAEEKVESNSLVPLRMAKSEFMLSELMDTVDEDE